MNEAPKTTYKHILAIALPLILGNTAWTCNGVFDTIFVGNLGKVQLDAIGFSSIFYSVLFMMGFNFTRGTQIIIARRMGEGNKHEVGNVTDTTIVAMVVVALFFFLLIEFFGKQILGFMLTNEDVIHYCDRFLIYRIWGVIPSFISFVFIAFYSGIGRTTILAVSILVMTVVNVSLNYCLVYGRFGFPELGISGSGLATAIAETFGALILLGGTFYKGRKHEFFLLRFKKIDRHMLKLMTNIAVPLMLQSLASVGSWLFLFARIETQLGKDSLAISSIFRQLILFFSIPTWSLGSTTNTIISHMVGKRDFTGLKDVIRRITIVSVSLAAISCVIIYLFPYFFIGIFTGVDGLAIIPEAIRILPVIFVIFILMSITNILFNSVISVGNVYTAMGIQVGVVVLYIIYFQVMFRMSFVNTFWIWTAEWFYWIAIMIGCIVFFRRKKLEIV